MELKLNLGCGDIQPPGWRNIDSSWNAQLQKLPVVGALVGRALRLPRYDSRRVVYQDLNRPWPYADGSVAVVYSSHVFEHLGPCAADLFLSESLRCLRSDGAFRIVVPDLYQLCKVYLADYEAGTSADPSRDLLWALNLHREGQYGAHRGWLARAMAWQQGHPHQHKYMYDAKSLTQLLRDKGFVDVVGASYGRSAYVADISDVEGTREAYRSVYLDARKPGA